MFFNKTTILFFRSITEAEIFYHCHCYPILKCFLQAFIRLLNVYLSVRVKSCNRFFIEFYWMLLFKCYRLIHRDISISWYWGSSSMLSMTIYSSIFSAIPHKGQVPWVKTHFRTDLTRTESHQIIVILTTIDQWRISLIDVQQQNHTNGSKNKILHQKTLAKLQKQNSFISIGFAIPMW